MKIDRRSFLSLGIGAAAGSALSPIPWKVTDDLSIWTQNWPWTPVPPDGAVTYENSACTLCPGGCGITVCKVDERVVKIEGMKGHPANDGGLCMLGLSGPQLLYSPVRIKTPMKKINGKWHKISWDAAIEEVVLKLKESRTADNINSVACLSESDTGTVPFLLNRFLTAFGSANFFRPLSFYDSYSATFKKMHGEEGIPAFDFENADYILSFGSGIIEGWGSPVRMLRERSAWKNNRKKKIVQIEPRLSNTAAGANQWVPIKPGTEDFFALGLANVILQEFLYNPNFINYYSSNFESWKEKVIHGFDPDKVAKITGVDAETIKSIGREFARSTKSIAICGRGEGGTPVSLAESCAVHSLNALAGNINQKGGIWRVNTPDYISWPAIKIDSEAVKGLAKGRLDGAGSDPHPDAKYLTSRFPKAVLSGNAEINILFLSKVNPCHTMHDTENIKKAFQKIPFKVSFSSYMDDTTELCDLVLPNHVWLERFEDIPVTSGLTKPIIGLAKPVVKPLFNTRHTGDVIIEMARKMGGSISESFPWDSYETCIKETLGDRWNHLRENGFTVEASYIVQPWNAGFKTDTGKFKFPDIDGLMANRPEPEGNKDKYPLMLIPVDSMRISSGNIGSTPFMVKTVSDEVLKNNDIVVEINPATAQRFGLSEGEYAQIVTPGGTARVKVNTFEGIMPDIIAMQRGLGHSGYDKYLAGKGDNVNRLIRPVEDSASGFDTAWGIRANLLKA